MANGIINVTDQEFQGSVLGNQKPVLVDFWAPWCGPCRAIAPALEELAKEYGDKVVVAKVNVDDNPQAPSQYGVRGIPTLIMFKGGKAVDQVVGAVPKAQLKAMMERASA